MDLSNTEFRATLCCLHQASVYKEQLNFTKSQYITLATVCFSQNTSALPHVPTFIHKYQDVINLKACSPLPPITTDICDIPTSSGNLIYTVFLFILMAIIFATNSFYCLAIFRSRALLRHPSHRFILSLAVSDLLVALVAIPIIIDLTLHNQAFCSSKVLCHLAYFVDQLVFLSFIMTLLAIGIDRYLAVSKPYKYQQLMSQTRSTVIIVSIWVLSSLFGITANIDWSSMTFHGVEINQSQMCFTRNPKYTGVVIATCFFVPVILMGFLYYRIFRETLKHALPIATIGKLQDVDESDSNESYSGEICMRRISTMHTLSGENRPKQHVTCFSSAKLRALRAVIIVYGTFVICWLPGNVITLLNMFSPGIVTLDLWQYHLLNQILPLGNSAVNVFLYAVMNEDCKKAMQKLLCCNLVRRHVERKRLERERKRRASERSVVVTFRSSSIKHSVSSE